MTVELEAAVLPAEEIETVGSVGLPRRIYGYTLPGKDVTAWQRTVGQTLIKGKGLIKVGETTKAVFPFETEAT